MFLSPWHLALAYLLDLILGDPQQMPHPIRWIGRLISRFERVLYREDESASRQRTAGTILWFSIVLSIFIGTFIVVRLSGALHAWLGHLVLIWLAYACLAIRSLHAESRQVVEALSCGDIDLARKRLSRIVSRDTQQLDERDILRAVIETVSENLSDGIVAPLFYLALGGVMGGLTYKAVNTLDSMIGYLNRRYQDFGWFAAKSDDLANWIPSRLTGLLIIASAGLLKMDWLAAWRIMRRDASKMKSPNAGFPEAAACGALGIQLGGTNWYFGRPVAKPTLGDSDKQLTSAVYHSMIRLLYVSSFIAFILAMGVRCWVFSI